MGFQEQLVCTLKKIVPGLILSASLRYAQLGPGKDSNKKLCWDEKSS